MAGIAQRGDDNWRGRLRNAGGAVPPEEEEEGVQDQRVEEDQDQGGVEVQDQSDEEEEIEDNDNDDDNDDGSNAGDRNGHGGNGGAGDDVAQRNGRNGGRNGHDGNGGDVHPGNGNNGGGNGGGVRRNGENERQPPRNQDRRGPYGPVRRMETSNMEVISGQSGTQQFHTWKTKYTVSNNMVTINEVLTSEDTHYKGKFLVAYILSIKRNEASGRPVMMQRRIGRETRNESQVQYVRIIRIFCPHSPAGSNVLCILEGNGQGNQLFNFDPTNRDNGVISKYRNE